VKNGKRPTVKQMKLMQERHLNPADWLVTKDTSEEMHLVHRYSDSTKRIIQKERG